MVGGLSRDQAEVEMEDTAQQEILSLITTDTAVAWAEGNRRDNIHSLTYSSSTGYTHRGAREPS